MDPPQKPGGGGAEDRENDGGAAEPEVQQQNQPPAPVIDVMGDANLGEHFSVSSTLFVFGHIKTQPARQPFPTPYCHFNFLCQMQQVPLCLF